MSDEINITITLTREDLEPVIHERVKSLLTPRHGAYADRTADVLAQTLNDALKLVVARMLTVGALQSQVEDVMRAFIAPTIRDAALTELKRRAKAVAKEASTPQLQRTIVGDVP